MNIYLTGTAFIIFGYLLGSVSFGLIIARIVKGIDIRQFASGSTGATNVMRACGWPWGILAMALDMFKAAVPLFIVLYIHDFGIPIWTHPFRIPSRHAARSEKLTEPNRYTKGI